MTDDLDLTQPMPLGSEPQLGPDAGLAAFVDALRAPATADELERETSTVDLMLAAIAEPVFAKDRRTMKNRIARSAALTAAMVLAAGGVAAAAAGGNPLRPIVSTSDETELTIPRSTATTTSTTPTAGPSTSTTGPTTTTTGTTTTTAPTTTIAAPATSTACGGDRTDQSGVADSAVETPNHGAEVSAAARDKSLDGDQTHGSVVSATARDKTACDEEADDRTDADVQAEGDRSTHDPADRGGKVPDGRNAAHRNDGPHRLVS